MKCLAVLYLQFNFNSYNKLMKSEFNLQSVFPYHPRHIAKKHTKLDSDEVEVDPFSGD